MTKTVLRHCILAIGLGFVLFHGIVHAQTLTDKKYVTPSVVTSSNYYEVEKKTCTYSMAGTYQGCPIQTTNWQICGCWYAYPTCPSQYIKCFTALSDFIQYFGYSSSFGTALKPVSQSATALVLETKAADLMSTAPLCPEQALATSTYSCTTCTKKTWYYDGDKDGKGDPFVTKYECNAPGSDWVLVAGDACPKDTGIFDPQNLCKDADGDGFPSGQTALVCPNTPTYAKCPWENGAQPIDCNDSDVTVKQKILQCTDADQDGYCVGFGDQIQSILECPKAAPYIPTATAKGVDCNDAQTSLKGKETWCSDEDGDGYCKGILKDGNWVYETFANCGNPGSQFKLVTASKGIDECDGPTSGWNQIQKQDKFCKDDEVDGFGDPDNCKMMCFWDEKYANPQGWAIIHPSLFNSGYDCKGTEANTPTEDPTTTGKNITPNMEWGVDCDGDGYVSELIVKKGCNQPPFTAVPQACLKVPVKPDGTQIAEYVRLKGPKGKDLKKGDCNDLDYKEFDGALWITDADFDGWYDPERSISQCKNPKFADALSVTIQCGDSPDPKCAEKAAKYSYQNSAIVGDKIKKGDCDDDDKNIMEIMYLFADQDGDSFGDPMVSKVVNCSYEPEVPEPYQCAEPSAAPDPKLCTDPATQDVKWVKKPDDLAPHDISLDRPSKRMLVTNTPTYCISQAAQSFCTQGAEYCETDGYLSMEGNEWTSVINQLSCISQVFRSLYCPSLGVMIPYGSSEWYLDGKLPYGTTLPILTFTQQIGITPLVKDLTNPSLYAKCFSSVTGQPSDNNEHFTHVLQTIGSMEQFLPISFGYQATNQAKRDELVLNEHLLVSHTGTDYVLDLPTYEKWYQGKSLPILEMGQIDFQASTQNFQKLNTLAELITLSKHLSIRIPFRPKKDPLLIQCAYQGKILDYVACNPKKDESLIVYQQPLSITQLLRDPSLLLAYLNDKQDTDGDGVIDIVELSLPYLSQDELQQIALNPNLTPKILYSTPLQQQLSSAIPSLTSPYQITLVTPLSSDPEVELLWKMGKERAHQLVDEVFDRSAEVLGGYKNIALTLQPEHWHILIEVAKPAHLWDSRSFFELESHSFFSDTFFENPLSPIYKLFGLNRSAKLDAATGQLSGEIYVDPWAIRDRYYNDGEKAVARVASTILHEILHSHICLKSSYDFSGSCQENPKLIIYVHDEVFGPVEQRKLEHEFIYGITGEFFDIGLCGTQF